MRWRWAGGGVFVLIGSSAAWLAASRRASPPPEVVVTNGPETAPEADVPDAAKIDSLCVNAQATASAKLAALWQGEAHDAAMPSDLPLIPCFAAADGAWTFEPKDVAFGEETGAAIDATLAYVRRSDRATLARSS